MAKSIAERLAELRPQADEARRKLLNRDLRESDAAKIREILEEETKLTEICRASDAADQLFKMSAEPGIRPTPWAEQYGYGTYGPGGGTGLEYRDWTPTGMRALAGAFSGQIASRGGFSRSKTAASVFQGTDSGVSVPLAADWTTIPAPAPGLLSVLPTKVIDGRYWEYLSQVTRTNNAAVVASPLPEGQTKPKSVYDLERKRGELALVAHLATVDVQILQDVSSLQQFMVDELLYGVRTAAEAEVVGSATGTGPGSGAGIHLTGLLKVSGTQSIDFSVDVLTTLRKSITAIETLGQSPDLVLLNPVDWETLSLTRTLAGDGSLEFSASGPTDAATRRIWGLPISLVAGIPAGTGVVLVKSAVSVVNDRIGNSIAWDPFTGLNRNEITARCEQRFGLECRQPLHVAVAKLTAGP